MRKKQLLIFLFLLFLFSGLILPNYNSALGRDYWAPGHWGIKTGGIDAWTDMVFTGINVGAKWVFSGIFALVTVVLIVITSAFLDLSQLILNIVTSSTFINIKFTDNLFVNTGWEITRGLTNIFVILGLIAIALATILRISSYQMKKTLPLLLIVALLINFTPMLCGLVIDASNIIMNHFLKGGALKTEEFFKLIELETSGLWTKKVISETLGRGVMVVGFNIFAGLIFLLFAFLFLFRYVALWMLVILSPLALFCYIFPATKKMWDQWLSQFIQWSFIGIPAAFTIYLANIMMVTLIEGGAIKGISGGAEILGYLVPLGFLVIGFLMSLQIGAIGASVATGWFKKGEALAWKGVRTGTEKVTRIPRKWVGEKLSVKTKIGKGGEEEKIEKTGLLAWAGRGLAANVARHEREEVENAEKQAKGKSFEEQYASVKSPILSRRMGTLHTIYEEGNIDKFTKATGFSRENKEEIMRDTLKFFPSMFKDLANSETKIAEKIVGETGKNISDILAKRAGVFMSDDDIKKYETLAEKLVSTASEKDISKWSEETMKTALESEVFHRSLKGSKISAMAKQFGDVFFETFKDNVAKEGWYETEAPAAHKYISSSAGKGLGVGFNEKKETPGKEIPGGVITTKEEREGKKEKKPGIGEFKSKV